MSEMTKPESAAPSAAPVDDERAAFRQALVDKIHVGTDFKERSPKERDEVLDDIQALLDFLKSDGTKSMIAEDSLTTIRNAQHRIDQIVGAQVNAILHAQEFQELEGTWRGLEYLVDNAGQIDNLKILVLDASKQELQQAFKIHNGDNIVYNPLFKKFYSDALDTYGANPYGCIVADYQFDHSGPDVDTMKGLAQIGAASLAPVITSAAPKLLNLGTWADAAKMNEYGPQLDDARHMEWQGLRKQEDARYLGVTMGRFLARRPYSQDASSAVFSFNEKIDGPGAENFVWCNASLAMATNVAKSFQSSGWAASIVGIDTGGTVAGLPTFVFQAQGGPEESVCPTEVPLNLTQARQLYDEGLIPLVYHATANEGCFFGAPSVQKATVYRDAAANQSAQLSMELPYIFAVSRFMQAVKQMALHYVGSAKNEAEIKTDLEGYLKQYVTVNPAVASDADKAKQPLASFSVDCKPDPRNAGYYQVTVQLQPLIKLKGMTAKFELVAKVAKSR